MASYNLESIKARSFHIAGSEPEALNDQIDELLVAAGVFIADLGENYTVVNLDLSYGESMEPYVTVYYE